MDCIIFFLLSMVSAVHASIDPVEELRMIYMQESNMSLSEFRSAQIRREQIAQNIPAARSVEHPVIRTLRLVRHVLPPFIWQIGWLVIWWLFLLYGTLASGGGKKIFLISTILFMTGIVVLDWYDTTRNDVLIVRDEVPARLTPSADAPMHMQLRRGTRVGITSVRNGYYNVRGGIGWVAAHDCVRIPLDIA